MTKPNAPTCRRRALVVYEEFGGHCFYCDMPLPTFKESKRHRNLGHPTIPLPTVEHVVPKEWGGRNHLENLVLACYDCNHGRGNRLIPEMLWRDRAELVVCLQTGKCKYGRRRDLLDQAGKIRPWTKQEVMNLWGLHPPTMTTSPNSSTLSSLTLTKPPSLAMSTSPSCQGGS